MGEVNILVVEDSATMRRLISFALSRIPRVKLIEAANGAEGLKRLSENSFDLVVTDLNMPVLDGLKLIGTIRARAEFSHMPIVVITTQGADEDRDRALSLGASAYATKPIKMNELNKLVRRLLRI